jgi:PTH1 family peptidyl-tRNA hydrolase
VFLPGFFIFVVMNKYLIVGLGNIGEEYVHTRHNIGFDVADALVKKLGGNFQTDRLADVAQCKLKGKTLFCIKPNTYMNLSGKAVVYWRNKEAIQHENILIVVDELALPLEKIRMRTAGSAGGHNGLKSIEECLATREYPRLRVGIGSNFTKGNQSDFVLSKWKPLEVSLIFHKINVCVQVIESFVLQGVTKTMNEFNKLIITV